VLNFERYAFASEAVTEGYDWKEYDAFSSEKVEEEAVVPYKAEGEGLRVE
jgi:hypothetical protein